MPRFKTLDDAYDAGAVPENHRGELIDGTLYTSPAPSGEHQWIQKLLAEELDDSARRGGLRPRGGWVICYEPNFVIDRGHLRPDLAGWRFDELPAKHVVRAAIEARPVPDWVCEVLSPGNPEHDTERKARLYAEAGVEWYWLIDPRSRTVGAYKLVKGAYTAEVIGSHMSGAEKPLPAVVPPFTDRSISWDDVFGNCDPPGPALVALPADLPAPAARAKRKK